MNLHQLPADPDAAATVQRIVDQLLAVSRNAGTQGKPQVPLASKLETSKLYALAEQLSDQDDFRNAMPVAMQLFIQEPQQPRAAYLLASCLQRLGQPGLAFSLFEYCTLTEGRKSTPGPLFRRGECLAALGRKDAAIESFDAAIDIARSDPLHADIQAMAQEKAAALRAMT